MEPACKTPLYDAHLGLGAKVVDFAGWLLPLWYPTGQTAEHGDETLRAFRHLPHGRIQNRGPGRETDAVAPADQ
jgi:aminomethyltransferase